MENAIREGSMCNHNEDSKLMRSGFGQSLSGNNEWPPKKCVVRSFKHKDAVYNVIDSSINPNPALPNNEKA